MMNPEDIPDIMTRSVIERQTKSETLRLAYKRIPVVVSTKKVVFTKKLFLIKPETSISHFMMSIRPYITNLTEADALYCFRAGGNLLSGHDLMGNIDTLYKDTDGFLKLLVEKEETFG